MAGSDQKVDGGLFSCFANDRLKKGDILEVMPPVGKFYVDLSPAHKKKLSRHSGRQRYYTGSFYY